MLLTEPSSDTGTAILSAIRNADAGIGADIGGLLRDEERPCLILALNGMQSFDLTAEVTRQVLIQLKARDLDSSPLDELRPRFKQVANLIKMSDAQVTKELLDVIGEENVDVVLNDLEEQNEAVYAGVQEFFANRGMPIRAFGGESVRDVIDVIAREYCGEGKPFRHALILFDEFGRYTEFATIRSQVAGSGVLQDMFEGVQAHADHVTFVGFIQFELNAYVQRVAPEYRNDILRYITRYQSASKVYLSINLETLIAHLIEKQIDDFDEWFEDEPSRDDSRAVATNIHHWFPQSVNYRLWSDLDSFHMVVKKGCWPLSPLTTWFLFSLASGGKHLQERSALALLGDLFQRFQNREIENTKDWCIAPVGLWSDALQHELISTEESGQQGSITHSYASITARYAAQLSENAIAVLRAVVLVSKMGLQVGNRDEAIKALGSFSGLSTRHIKAEVELLQNEFNVIEWDERFNQFDILSEAVSRTQFLSFIRQRVANAYDEKGKAKLFISRAAKWCDDNLLSDLSCDFAERNSITSTEWRYLGVTANLESLESQIKLAADRWIKAIAVDEPRGTIIYCYVEPSLNHEEILLNIKKKLRTLSQKLAVNVEAIPVLVVLLCDEGGRLGQSVAEMAVLEDSISEEDRARFGNLISAHREKTKQIISNLVGDFIKQRRYVTALAGELEAKRLSQAGSELFSRIYPQPLPFPFDGFRTARGNAADDCQELITDLLRGALDYDAVMSKPVRVKNRAMMVLNKTWQVFTKTGRISRGPSHPVARAIVSLWDEILKDDQQRFVVGEQLAQNCLPSFGANIASVGLLFSVFVASRSEQLVIVREGEQCAISKWLQEGIFKRKFLDLTALQKVELAFVGEASAEWENLLDEWEQVESYLGKKSYIEKALRLKERIPVPPTCDYRFMHLQDQAVEAIQILDEIDSQIEDALQKIENGIERNNVSLLSWGATKLKKIVNKMDAEGFCWEKHQIEELKPQIEESTQVIVQVFSGWLAHQQPRNDSPEAVGDFKHRMVRKIGNNLRQLGLDDLVKDLEKHTSLAVQQAELIAAANQLLRNVKSWLSQHADALRFTRINDIRGLKDVGKDYADRLQKFSRHVNIEEIATIRVKLDKFLGDLKTAEETMQQRAMQLWDSKIHSERDLNNLSTEVSFLVGAYEGCERDIDDLLIIERALQSFAHHYSLLKDINLTWNDFSLLAEKLRSETKNDFGDEELPWSIDEVFENFVKNISEEREKRATEWIELVKADAERIHGMSVGEANHLHSKVNNYPAVISEENKAIVEGIIVRIENHLESLKLDWVIEKFKELSDDGKKKFIAKIPELVN
jgi:hypothetical protein